MRALMFISATIVSLLSAMLFSQIADCQTQRELDDIHYIVRGENAAKRGDLRTAVSHFRKAVELNPENPRAYASLSPQLMTRYYRCEIQNMSVRRSRLSGKA